MTTEPLPMPAERWAGDLGFLFEIPRHERLQWRLAPPAMNYREAHRWARDEIGAEKVIHLGTGETLVHLAAARPPART